MKFCRKKTWKYKYVLLLTLAAVSILMHLPHMNKDLISFHVWRQTQTQTVIDNFYEEDFNILNPRINNRGNGDGIFRMEFPVMQWLVANIYRITGRSITVTRILMLITGFLSVAGIYFLLLMLFENEFVAATGAWAFNFSPSFYYYTINPMPDNFALAAGIWGLAMFFMWYRKKKTYMLVLSSMLIALAALAKLPFILYYAVPFSAVVYLCLRKKAKKCTALFFYSFGFALLPLAWYISVIPGWHGNIIVKGMLSYKDNILQLLDYYQHNLISTLPELLINYGSLVFFLAGIYYAAKNKIYRSPVFIFLASGGLVLISYYLFEANAIAKVHDYYLFVFYPFLFSLVAYGIKQLTCRSRKIVAALSVFMLAILPLTCGLRMEDRWDINHPGFNKDLYLYKTQLQNSVPDTSLVIAGPDESGYIFLYYIHKKGWNFYNLPGKEKVKDMIAKGAKYLYTDLPEKDLKHLQSLIDRKIAQYGSIRVYKLKCNKTTNL